MERNRKRRKQKNSKRVIKRKGDIVEEGEQRKGEKEGKKEKVRKIQRRRRRGR